MMSFFDPGSSFRPVVMMSLPFNSLSHPGTATRSDEECRSKNKKDGNNPNSSPANIKITNKHLDFCTPPLLASLALLTLLTPTFPNHAPGSTYPAQPRPIFPISNRPSMAMKTLSQGPKCESFRWVPCVVRPLLLTPPRGYLLVNTLSQMIWTVCLNMAAITRSCLASIWTKENRFSSRWAIHFLCARMTCVLQLSLSLVGDCSHSFCYSAHPTEHRRELLPKTLLTCR